MCDQIIVGGKYRAIRKIGSGNFGVVYLGITLVCGKEVAIKMEAIDVSRGQLLNEYKLYQLMVGGVGIPRILYYGQAGNYNVLVMELLGQSLSDVFISCNLNFTTKTNLMIVDQMIDRMEFLHSKDIIHRDIKLGNVLIGTGSQRNMLFLIDFGLAAKYRDNGAHIPYRKVNGFIGNRRFASRNAHLGIEQSRRDDLESLGYVMLYLSNGSLPWLGLTAASEKQLHERISEMKLSTSVQVFCKCFPDEFERYWDYCRSLSFDESPNYTYLRNLFRRQNHQYDWIFDWN